MTWRWGIEILFAVLWGYTVDDVRHLERAYGSKASPLPRAWSRP